MPEIDFRFQFQLSTISKFFFLQLFWFIVFPQTVNQQVCLFSEFFCLKT